MVGLGTLWTSCRKTEVYFHLQISFFNRKKIICQEGQNSTVWQILTSQKEEHMTTISLSHTHRKYKESDRSTGKDSNCCCSIKKPNLYLKVSTLENLWTWNLRGVNCTPSRGTRLTPQAAGVGCGSLQPEEMAHRPSWRGKYTARKPEFSLPYLLLDEPSSIITFSLPQRCNLQSF